MDRPLWQIVLTLIAIGFAVERGGAAAMAFVSGAPAHVVALEAALSTAALVAAVVIFRLRVGPRKSG